MRVKSILNYQEYWRVLLKRVYKNQHAKFGAVLAMFNFSQKSLVPLFPSKPTFPGSSKQGYMYLSKCDGFFSDFLQSATRHSRNFISVFLLFFNIFSSKTKTAILSKNSHYISHTLKHEQLQRVTTTTGNLNMKWWIWGEKMFCGYVASFLESSCVFGFEPSNSLWTILEIVCDESNYSWFIFPVAVTQALGFHSNDCFWYHLAAMIHR